jgi:hypothetical protein
MYLLSFQFESRCPTQWVETLNHPSSTTLCAGSQRTLYQGSRHIKPVTVRVSEHLSSGRCCCDPKQGSGSQALD